MAFHTDLQEKLPMIILSATSFLPLCGQSISDTPQDCSSERRAIDFTESCSGHSKYALNVFTLPY